MLPYLHIFHFNLPTFGLMLWLAAVAAAFIMDHNFKRDGIDADAVGMVAITALLGIVGAKLWHVIDTPSEFRSQGWSVLWDTGGFAWFGGLVFGISALAFQGWWAKIGVLRTLDLAAPAAAVGYGVGPHRVFSFRGRLLRDSDHSALGNELPARHRAHPPARPSHPSIRTGRGPRHRFVALAPRSQTPRHWRHRGPIPDAHRNSSLSG